MARSIDDLKHLLELEYNRAGSVIDKFDEYRARTKSWMITSVGGLATIAIARSDGRLLWVAVILVLIFGVVELYYMDIQEDAIVRSNEIEGRLDSLSWQDAEMPDYRFGIGITFGGGRLLRVGHVLRWVKYRTFNPFLYGGLIVILAEAAVVQTVTH